MTDVAQAHGLNGDEQERGSFVSLEQGALHAVEHELMHDKAPAHKGRQQRVQAKVLAAVLSKARFHHGAEQLLPCNHHIGNDDVLVAGQTAQRDGECRILEEVE